MKSILTSAYVKSAAEGIETMTHMTQRSKHVNFFFLKKTGKVLTRTYVMSATEGVKPSVSLIRAHHLDPELSASAMHTTLPLFFLRIQDISSYIKYVHLCHVSSRERRIPGLTT